MQLSQRHLLGLPVRTRSGFQLGKLIDLIIDTDTGCLVWLVVRTRGIIPALLDQELRIAKTQIILMGEKEIIVTDGSVPTQGSRLAVQPPSIQPNIGLE